MAADRVLFEAVAAVIRQAVPRFATRWKSQVWLEVWIAAALWCFNPLYLTRYVTTLHPWVDFPREDPAAEAGAWKTLAHEYVHLWDRQRLGWWFVLLYGFPQILTPLALLAIGAVWWPGAWWALLFLGCAAPWPAPGRVWAELRGYTMSMAVNFWRYGAVTDATLAWIEPQFTGWAYFKMAWGAPRLRARLRAQADAVTSGRILVGPANAPFRELKAVVDRHGEVARG